VLGAVCAQVQGRYTANTYFPVGCTGVIARYIPAHHDAEIFLSERCRCDRVILRSRSRSCLYFMLQQDHLLAPQRPSVMPHCDLIGAPPRNEALDRMTNMLS
jgi:hypothetical protein